MRTRRKATDLGLGLLFLIGIAEFVAGVVFLAAHHKYNAQGADLGFVWDAEGMLVFAGWLAPYALTGTIVGLRYWWTHGKPGLWRTVTEPVTEDLRKASR